MSQANLKSRPSRLFHSTENTKEPNLLLLPLQINNSGPYLFLVDSGSPFPYIDRNLARRLKLPTTDFVFGLFGHKRVKANCTFFGTTCTDLSLELLPSTVTKQKDFAFDAVLGYEFFERHILTLDYQAFWGHISDPDSFVPPNSAKSVPIRIVSKLPIVDVALRFADGSVVNLPLEIDTGCSSDIFLTPITCARYNLNRKLHKSYPVEFWGVHGRYISRETRIASVRFGSVEIPEPVVGLDWTTPSENNLAGVIGMGLLKRFKFTLDYRGKRLLLEPTSKPSTINRRYWMGYTMSTDNHVTQVFEGSPAESAGLRIQDLIVSVDCQPTEETNSIALSHENSPFVEGSSCAMKIIRNGRQLLLHIIPEAY